MTAQRAAFLGLAVGSVAAGVLLAVLGISGLGAGQLVDYLTFVASAALIVVGVLALAAGKARAREAVSQAAFLNVAVGVVGTAAFAELQPPVGAVLGGVTVVLMWRLAQPGGPDSVTRPSRTGRVD